MSKKKKKLKFSIYFDPENKTDATQLAMLEFCRIESQLTKGSSGEPMGMGKFIRFMAVEFALRIEDLAKKEGEELAKKEAEKTKKKGMKVHND